MFKTHRTFDLSTGVKNASISVVNTGTEIFVVYHKTIVFHAKGGKVTLNNGGWDTISTRMVINRALELYGMSGMHLYTSKKVTYLFDGKKTHVPFENRAVFKSIRAA